jgi:hypothetical protein
VYLPSDCKSLDDVLAMEGFQGDCAADVLGIEGLQGECAAEDWVWEACRVGVRL